MNSRVIVNIVLFGAMLVLGLVVYFQPGIKGPTQPPLLTNLSPDQVSEIAIERPGKESIRLQKKSGVWQMTAPLQVTANKFRIDSLVQIVQAKSHSHFAAESAALEKYRLASPLAKLTINNNIELAFGDSEPLNHRRYLHTGDTVHIIADQYFYYAIADVTSYINLSLLPENSHISKITLPGAMAEHLSTGEWRLSPSIKDKVSADQVQALFDHWQQTQALQISRYQGDKVNDKVVVDLDGPVHQIVFQILEREPEFILGRDDLGLRYHLSDDQARRLLRPWDEANDGNESLPAPPGGG